MQPPTETPVNTPTTVEAEPQSQWTFNADDQSTPDSAVSTPPQTETPPLIWQTTKADQHTKTTSWFLLYFFATVIILAGAYLLTRDFITVGSLGVVALIFAIGSSYQARAVDYALDNHGLYVGNKFYPYSQFKSFSITHEKTLNSLLLLPMKRFMPMIAAGYPPQINDQILNALDQHLPYQEHEPDMIDRLTSRLHL